MIEEELDPKPISKYPFQTLGPFEFGRDVDLSDRPVADDFWDEIDEKHAGLRRAIGVYIFVVQPTKRSSLIPWYVGKTEKGSFEARFHSHGPLFAKLRTKKGRRFFFLIARTEKDPSVFMKSKKKLDSVDILETMLIERCLDVNGELYNAKKVAHVKGLIVPGFKGKAKGKPKLSAQQLKLMLKKSAPKEL